MSLLAVKDQRTLMCSFYIFCDCPFTITDNRFSTSLFMFIRKKSALRVDSFCTNWPLLLRIQASNNEKACSWMKKLDQLLCPIWKKVCWGKDAAQSRNCLISSHHQKKATDFSLVYSCSSTKDESIAKWDTGFTWSQKKTRKAKNSVAVVIFTCRDH